MEVKTLKSCQQDISRREMLAIVITGISIAQNECKVSEIVGKVQRSAEVKKNLEM